MVFGRPIALAPCLIFALTLNPHPALSLSSDEVIELSVEIAAVEILRVLDEEQNQGNSDAEPDWNEFEYTQYTSLLFGSPSVPCEEDSGGRSSNPKVCIKSPTSGKTIEIKVTGPGRADIVMDGGGGATIKGSIVCDAAGSHCVIKGRGYWGILPGPELIDCDITQSTPGGELTVSCAKLPDHDGMRGRIYRDSNGNLCFQEAGKAPNCSDPSTWPPGALEVAEALIPNLPTASTPTPTATPSPSPTTGGCGNRRGRELQRCAVNPTQPTQEFANMVPPVAIQP